MVRSSDAIEGSKKLIRRLVWVYLFLLLFEGAFRKWITPGLSNYLLIVRDPVVILIYLIAAAGGLFSRGFFVTSLAAVAVLTGICGFLARDFDLRVYLFGMRTDFLHLGLIFVIPNALEYKDVSRIGRWFLIISIPMTFLTVRQFQADPMDLINTTAGGGGLQLGTSGGKVRTTGTFSFIAGVICFYSVVAAFVINGFLVKKTYPKWLLIAGTCGVVMGVATSGSRSALGAVGGVAAVVVLAVFARPEMIGRLLVAAVLLGIVVSAVMQSDVVNQGTDLLTMRFAEAGGGGGFWPRLFGGMFLPIGELTTAPLTGCGLGYGTNAGAAMLQGGSGKVDFLLAEDEWKRVILESGPICGSLFILWRCALAVNLFRLSMRRVREGNMLPLLLFASCGLFIWNGQFGQPTILGFAALLGGLCLAAANRDTDNLRMPEVKECRGQKSSERRRLGRSRYAEALHGNHL